MRRGTRTSRRAPSRSPAGVEAAADRTDVELPETYIGTDRAKNFASIPAGANPASASPTQVLGKRRRQFGLPIAHRFMAEDEPAGQEHLGQIPQAQLVTQPAEHHECDDIARILHTVSKPTLRSLNCLPQFPHRYRR